MNPDHTAPRRRRRHATPDELERERIDDMEALPQRPVSPAGDIAARLLAVIEVAVATVEDDVRALTLDGGLLSQENIDRVKAHGTWSSETRGQVVRADANVSRRKLTLPAIEKGIADLSPDERATLMERLGSGGERNVLG